MKSEKLDMKKSERKIQIQYPRFPKNPNFQPDHDFSKKYLDISCKASMQMLDGAVSYKSSA